MAHRIPLAGVLCVRSFQQMAEITRNVLYGVQRPTEVTAYFSSKQLLLFAFARHLYGVLFGLTLYIFHGKSRVFTLLLDTSLSQFCVSTSVILTYFSRLP